VQALLDGMDSNTASTALGYLQALTASYSGRLVVRALERRGIEPERPAVAAETRVWYNPELESARFLVPGLIALILMLSCVVSTALSLVREKERGTMEQVMVSPVRPSEVIAGKILPYVLISLLTAGLILLFGSLLFDVRVRGSLIELLVAILVFLFPALGLGLFISSRTRSQQVAFMFSLFATLLPSVLLSGLIFPIKNMPLPIRLLTYAVPPRHFIVILRAIILKGVGLADLLPELSALGLIGLAFYTLAVAGTRKRGH
jgi:ABC-2 type transport system permease protein